MNIFCKEIYPPISLTLPEFTMASFFGVLTKSSNLTMRMDTYYIYPLGDSAMTVAWKPEISPEVHERVLAAHQQLLEQPFEGLLESVIAYNSLTVYYDSFSIKKKYAPETSVSKWVEETLRARVEAPAALQKRKIRRHIIPVCYDMDMGTDLAFLASERNCPVEKIIAAHCQPVYRVYMTGFQPGFPYLGELPEFLHCQRKQKPVPVEAGSVAIAGKQTGIYPFNGPGGWQIVGRTPLVLFDPLLDPPVAWKPGDEIQFFPITKSEYTELKKQKIHVDPGT